MYFYFKLARAKFVDLNVSYVEELKSSHEYLAGSSWGEALAGTTNIIPLRSVRVKDEWFFACRPSRSVSKQKNTPKCHEENPKPQWKTNRRYKISKS